MVRRGSQQLATAPLLEFYRDQPVAVDAVGTVDEVTERVFEKLPGKQHVRSAARASTAGDPAEPTDVSHQR